MSKFSHVSDHPLARLLDGVGLTHAHPLERAQLHRAMVGAAREAALAALFEPKGERASIVAHGLWSAWQTRTGDRPVPSRDEFLDLGPAAQAPWIALAAAMMPAVVAEALA